MIKNKLLYRIVPLLLIAFTFISCESDVKDIAKVQEQLELKASSSSIALDADNINDDIITFNWTEARQMPNDYVITYETKLDVVGNNFGTATAIFNYEDEGSFSRSFTSEQLQNWTNDKWKIPANRSFTLEFRVIAKWEGGATFEMPEVRTVTVEVQPIRTVVFDADKIHLKGTAVSEASGVEIKQTLENENVYASLLNLKAGSLNIPVEFEGQTNYICPIETDGEFKDAETIKLTMKEDPVNWKIPSDGQLFTPSRMIYNLRLLYGIMVVLKLRQR